MIVSILLYEYKGSCEDSVDFSLVRQDTRTIIGAQVDRFWGGDNVWHLGTIVGVSARRNSIAINYDDRDFEAQFPLEYVCLSIKSELSKVRN